MNVLKQDCLFESRQIKEMLCWVNGRDSLNQHQVSPSLPRPRFVCCPSFVCRYQQCQHHLQFDLNLVNWGDRKF